MTAELALTGARIVTPDAVIDGSLTIGDGYIQAVGPETPVASSAEDLSGDYLMPGLVELHTDNLEKHMVPRTGIWWPGLPAMLAHDAQVAAAGITTVYDALTLGDRYRAIDTDTALADLVGAVREAHGRRLLRADHRIHLRCEVTHPGLLPDFDRIAADPLVGLVSLMDHTPGDRQFSDVAEYKRHYQHARDLTSDEADAHIAELVDNQVRFANDNRSGLVARCHERGLVLASHDDAGPHHVAIAKAEGVAIAEFPTSRSAAEAARDVGLKILMGAPNLVRGKSHSGNVAAAELAEHGLLDILSSDYYPASLLHAAFVLTQAPFDLSLPEASAIVSANPARQVGLDDRGEIRPGMRADLIRVAMAGDIPVIRGVWRAGRRVA